MHHPHRVQTAPSPLAHDPRFRLLTPYQKELLCPSTFTTVGPSSVAFARRASAHASSPARRSAHPSSRPSRYVARPRTLPPLDPPVPALPPAADLPDAAGRTQQHGQATIHNHYYGVFAGHDSGRVESAPSTTLQATPSAAPSAPAPMIAPSAPAPHPAYFPAPYPTYHPPPYSQYHGCGRGCGHGCSHHAGCGPAPAPQASPSVAQPASQPTVYFVPYPVYAGTTAAAAAPVAAADPAPPTGASPRSQRSSRELYEKFMADRSHLLTASPGNPGSPQRAIPRVQPKFTSVKRSPRKARSRVSTASSSKVASPPRKPKPPRAPPPAAASPSMGSILELNKSVEEFQPSRSLQWETEELREVHDGHTRFVTEEGDGRECAMCKEAIFGSAVLAMDCVFHPNHFVCAYDRKPFDNLTFIPHNGLPYCEAHYHELFSPHCARQGCPDSIIRGVAISALGVAWHQECFVCAVCNEPFPSGEFFEFEGQPYCSEHFALATGTVCTGCGEAIIGIYVVRGGEKFHDRPACLPSSSSSSTRATPGSPRRRSSRRALRQSAHSRRHARRRKSRRGTDAFL
ncbi:PXL-1 protein [Thecamonas trahens ATCC 50062]|uniref:PXL-1 protein n=1 Tax=Thecamonas trahens ATCC 50062 TaxID=461836 RepID=A0A0L0DBJ1_THETB|nr:PXL-1 protein [Thecamonas trahens ATCC 50062]KNC48663.1 PXL-1 protein [Thecamonas trahens ATCC 50062]|eukprot:XP_013762719.1 PXL-1 protein [Thecamonas trahens ATCC 50062]